MRPTQTSKTKKKKKKGADFANLFRMCITVLMETQSTSNNCAVMSHGSHFENGGHLQHS